jgi:hypothetical protein
MPAGSATTTRSNSSPFAWETVRRAAAASSDSGWSPGIASGTAADRAGIRASGAMIARRPPSGPPSAARSARAWAATPADRPLVGTWTAFGPTPSERTESGGRSSGETDARTSAATTMISDGVR